MKVWLRDSKLALSGWSDALKELFPYCDAGSEGKDLETVKRTPDVISNTVVFLHEQRHSKDWLQAVARCPTSFLVLIGSSGYQGTIRDGDYGRVFRCHWTADEFKLQRERAIREFISSFPPRDAVQTMGHPHFALLKMAVVEASYTQLAALAFLCQGYLVLRNRNFLFGRNVGNVPRTSSSLEGQTCFTTRSAQRLFRPWIKSQDNNITTAKAKMQQQDSKDAFWFDECILDVRQTSWERLTIVFPVLASKTGLQELWCLIRGECCGEQDNGQARRLVDSQYSIWKEADVTDLIIKAHRDYCSLFFGEFDQQRQSLNHKSVGNDFISLIGNTRKGIKKADAPEVRFERVLTAWKSLRDPGSIREEDELAKIRLVNDARKNWPLVKQRLREFLDQEPKRWGLKLSAKGTLARERAFKGQKSFCHRIDAFLGSFEKLAKMDHDNQMSELDCFAEAIDSLQQMLHEMRHVDSTEGLFGGHFDFVA